MTFFGISNFKLYNLKICCNVIYENTLNCINKQSLIRYKDKHKMYTRDYFI